MRTEARSGSWVAVAAVLAVALRVPVAAQTLDEFEDVSGWTASASDGSRVEIAQDTGHTGMGLRIDFELGGGGYVIVRKAMPLKLPANYSFKFFIRGEAPPNTLQFKLADRSGQNVWWYRQRDFAFPTEWHEVTVKKARLEFAWGPAGGGAPKQIAAVEIAITAGQGGKGSVWIDDLQLQEREPPVRADVKPKVTASSSVPGHEPERALERDRNTTWRSGELAASQWMLLDFGKPREYGGLVIDWDADDYAIAYDVEVSDDGERWTAVFSTTNGNGGRDYVYIPDGESRYIRLALKQTSRGQGYAIRTVTVEPFEFSASPNQFFATVAADAPPGTYPKYFSEKQTYWTVIGVSGDDKKALLNEEGMLEVDKGAFSIEPFLFADGKLITWKAVLTSQALADGYLPIPSVTWHADQLRLTITAFAAGKPGASSVYAQYRVENLSDQYRSVDLFLAIRPFQVLPPWQSLNMVGGATPIRDLVFASRTVWVNRKKAVISLTPPDRFGAATFEDGSATDFLLHDATPPDTQTSDLLGYASGALQYHLNLAPQGDDSVYLTIPFHEADAAVASADTDGAAARFRTQLDDTVRYWRTVVGHVDLQLPPLATRITQTLKSTLTYMLINRDGDAIEPGARNYARTWIRDGTLISNALLSMGNIEEVRAFIRWYAGYQRGDGGIPCCVDRRGADPVPEHDSEGEFVYAVAQYYRYTHDIGFLNETWPAVVKAVQYIDALRQQRRTEAYQQPDKAVYFGLLPESISHEGYSSRPVHSYWDDFFALRGLKDAAFLARVVGDDEHAAAFVTLHNTFRTDLYASIVRSIAEHGIDYIPGSAELGDFDPTSTAIALTMGSEEAFLPQKELRRTFDLYYEHVQERQRVGPEGDDAYTPYELRNVGALVRLGERDRALAILDLMLDGQRPQAWDHWAEVVWRNPAAPKFIGDMPHTWVGSGFVNSLRTMLAYEREADNALVLAAGLPAAWVMNDPGVTVKRLPTHYGILSYSLRAEGVNTLRLTLSGDLTLPAGRIVVQPPLPQPLTAVTVNGTLVTTFDAHSATISEFPADVVLEYALPATETPTPSTIETPSTTETPDPAPRDTAAATPTEPSDPPATDTPEPAATETASPTVGETAPTAEPTVVAEPTR